MFDEREEVEDKSLAMCVEATLIPMVSSPEVYSDGSRRVVLPTSRKLAYDPRSTRTKVTMAQASPGRTSAIIRPTACLQSSARLMILPVSKSLSCGVQVVAGAAYR